MLSLLHMYSNIHRNSVIEHTSYNSHYGHYMDRKLNKTMHMRTVAESLINKLCTYPYVWTFVLESIRHYPISLCPNWMSKVECFGVFI